MPTKKPDADQREDTSPANTRPPESVSSKVGGPPPSCPPQKTNDTAGKDSLTGHAIIDAALLATLGWWVTHFFASRREIRKERRAEVDACCKMCAELLDKARNYYISDSKQADAQKLASEIRFDFQRLLKRSERLQKWDRRFDVQPALDQLMESLTGGCFDSANRESLTLDSPKLSAIENDTHDLMDRLEAGFAAKYG